MFVSADEVVRSLRGTAGLIGFRSDALHHFDVSERGFWRSFGAVWLTAPAVTVALALERGAGTAPFQLDHVTVAVLAGVMAGFLAVPLAMIAVLRRLGRTRAYVPFVVVTNWCLATGLAALALPGCLLLLDLATPGLAALDAGAFLVVMLWLHGRATRAILDLPGPAAAFVTLACFGLIAGIAGGAHTLV
ncbi:hypothetical protein [Methylobacterium frigidaeris]|uniref:Yip1 domain-containing protein n=1 Tax=Methylobacterium frigidaeris TaxID=2038277 RepID=A0AA37M7C5_9HYPH|nr:hypothetical protein [Methylobacterium frigidaeris]PIK74896.1 hypothetical protein CS379_00130 [Methylobacterium frigidaeris]GJD64869.1 hypothetical protein MPEAHAMD_5054 [Methylobacterium frigidaeris]